MSIAKMIKTSHGLKNVSIKEITSSDDESTFLSMIIQRKRSVPNETTIQAIEEGKNLVSDPSALRYSSMDDLKESLDR